MSGLFRVFSARGKVINGFNRCFSQVTILPNRVRVVTYPTEDPSATVAVSIDGGSASETAKNSGSAYFLEQILLTGHPRSQEVQRAIENSGSILTSSTRREQTLISLQSAPQQASDNVGVLSDLLQGGAVQVSDEGVESVRKVVLEEQRSVEIKRLVFENLHASAYQESGLGLPVYGLPDNVRSISAADLQTYAAQYLRPENISVVAVGNVQHDAIVRAVEQKLRLTSSSSTASDKKAPQKNVPYIGSMVTVQDDELPTTSYAIALKGVGLSHPDNLSLSLLTYAFHPTYDRNVSGGLALSPRYSRIVSEEKQANLVEPFFFSYGSTGLFGVYFETEPEKPFDAIWEVLNNFHRVSNNLTSAELARAKALYRSRLIKNETTQNIVDNLSRLSLQQGQVRKSLNDRLKELDAITLERAQKTFDEYTTDIEPAISAHGNLLHFPDYSYIRNWTSWRRL